MPIKSGSERPDLAGELARKSGDLTIQLIDMDGKRHAIRDGFTLYNLFVDDLDLKGIIKDGPDMDDIELGDDISYGAMSAKDPNDAAVWFIEPDKHVKRWVTSSGSNGQVSFWVGQNSAGLDSCAECDLERPRRQLPVVLIIASVVRDVRDRSSTPGEDRPGYRYTSAGSRLWYAPVRGRRMCCIYDS